MISARALEVKRSSAVLSNIMRVEFDVLPRAVLDQKSGASSSILPAVEIDRRSRSKKRRILSDTPHAF